MKVRTMLTLTHDEVQERIPYAMICATRFGAAWDSSKRRRRWLAEFSESEREAAGRLFRIAYGWYLCTGVPDQVEMSARTLALWLRLGEFCGSL